MKGLPLSAQDAVDFLYHVWQYAISCNAHWWWMAFPFIAYLVEFLPQAFFWERGIRSSPLPASGLFFLAIPSVLLWGEEVPSPLILPMPEQRWAVAAFKLADVLYVSFWWSVYWCLALRWYPYWLFWRGFLHPYHREQMVYRMMFWGHPLSPYTFWTLWKTEFVGALRALLEICALDWWVAGWFEKRELLRKISPTGTLYGLCQYYLSTQPNHERPVLQQWYTRRSLWSVHDWQKADSASWQKLPQVERDLLAIVDSRVSELWSDIRRLQEELSKGDGRLGAER